MEGVGAFEAGGVDGCSNIRLGLSGPHGAVAVGDFSLDDAWSQIAFAVVVGCLDLAGIVAKRQKLIAGPGDPGLDLVGQFAERRRPQDIGELPLEFALLRVATD